jgi:hypothetical protein
MAEKPLGEKIIAINCGALRERISMCYDISKEGLEQLYDEIDAEIKKNGLPTEKELRAEIAELNKTAPVKEQKKVKKHDFSM